MVLAQLARKLFDDGLAGENTGGKVVLINPADCLILLGSVVGCFEGIGLVLPIQVRHGTAVAVAAVALFLFFFFLFMAEGAALRLSLLQVGIRQTNKQRVKNSSILLFVASVEWRYSTVPAAARKGKIDFAWSDSRRKGKAKEKQRGGGGSRRGGKKLMRP